MSTQPTQPERLLAIMADDRTRHLSSARFRVSAVLSILMFAVYYGFILMLAFNKDFFAQPYGENLTIALPIGLGIIFCAWILTGVYTLIANTYFDNLVTDIKKSL